MKMITKVRNLIDREWIKVDWCGRQTIVHRLIAIPPLLIFGAVAGLQPSRAVGLTVVMIGMAGTIAITIWIEGRRLVGTGTFSTRRSERFVKRMGRGRSANPDASDDV